jgi:hypothetical protein
MLRGVYGVKINREFRHTLTHGDVSKIDCPPPLLLLERERGVGYTNTGAQTLALSPQCKQQII